MKIYLETDANILQKIRSKDLTICVIGLGTVGLPASTLFAKQGFTVLGLDIRQQRVNHINKGEIFFEYSDLLKQLVSQGKLVATTNPNDAIPKSYVVIICVQTPIEHRKELDLSYVQKVAEDLTNHIQKGMVIIGESSVTIGTTRFIGESIEKRTGLRLGIDVGLAYCPERYDPGLALENDPKIVYSSLRANCFPPFGWDKTSRVIGAFDKKSSLIAKTLYSQVVDAEIFEVSSIEVAEAAKLTENTFRDANIALVNELSKIYSKLGLDAFEIINAARTKPFAFLPHYPGTGVGGSCIPVDTWYLIKQAERLNLETKLIRTVREVNDSMPCYVVHLLSKALSKSGKSLKGSKICVLGLAYKKNVADVRESPSIEMVNRLKELGANVFLCDPMVGLAGADFDLIPIDEAFLDKDAVILATDHDVFRSIDLAQVKQVMKTPILIDGKNFFDEARARSLGFVYAGVGKADDLNEQDTIDRGQESEGETTYQRQITSEKVHTELGPVS